VLLYVLIVVLVLAAIAGALVLTRRRGAPPEPKAERPVKKRPPAPVEPPPEKPVAKEPSAPAAAVPPAEPVPPAEQPAAEPEPTQQPVAESAPTVRPPLRERLSRARSSFGQALVRVFRKDGLEASDWEDVEAVLLQADVGIAATTRIVADLRARAPQAGPDGLLPLVREELLAILGDADRELRDRDGLTVWLVTGVNGTGKTTTIGKLALREKERGRHVVLAAADTFRAAADTQLERWAERTGAEVVKHAPGADPAAVAFDGVKAAKSRGADLLIVDTAGRLHTKRNLMEELTKIRRVVEREAGPPSEVLLVLDATTGQNGIAQARAFTEAVEVTGIVLTKLDGTAKGGIVIAVQQELGIPVKLVGVGESAEDLEPFDPAAFIDALVG
jgi:fused signal recognition particle receptor